MRSIPRAFHCNVRIMLVVLAAVAAPQCLADEYYTSDVAYQSGEARPEPWEPNVTALLDPSNLKWKRRGRNRK